MPESRDQLVNNILLTVGGLDQTLFGRNIDGNKIIRRLRRAICVPCTTIVVAREQHKTLGLIFHIGILIADGIKGNRAPKMLSNAFP